MGEGKGPSGVSKCSSLSGEGKQGSQGRVAWSPDSLLMSSLKIMPGLTSQDWNFSPVEIALRQRTYTPTEPHDPQ